MTQQKFGGCFRIAHWMLTMDSSFWQSLQVPQLYILFYKVFVAYFTHLGNTLLDLSIEIICIEFCL